MKSPDRDAADELARKYDELSALMRARRYAFNDLNAHGKTILDFMNVWLDQAQDQARKAASELATLRRRVAEMEGSMAVPAVWSEAERDGMSQAYAKASTRHGHYESIFAAAAWLLRHRSPPTRKE